MQYTVGILSDRSRQRLHCYFCGGAGKCKHEDWKRSARQANNHPALQGLHSNYVTDQIIASQRLSSRLIKEYNIIDQMQKQRVEAVFNLQEEGEHPFCSADGRLHSSGFAYDAEELMRGGVYHYNFPWPDMSAPNNDLIIRTVQTMQFHIQRGGTVLVHCHAGLGRTGLLIACYLMYAQKWGVEETIKHIRMRRRGAIQTKHQVAFVREFEEYLRDLRAVIPLPTVAGSPLSASSLPASSSTGSNGGSLMTPSPVSDSSESGRQPRTGGRAIRELRGPVSPLSIPSATSGRWTFSECLRRQNLYLHGNERRQLMHIPKFPYEVLLRVKSLVQRDPELRPEALVEFAQLFRTRLEGGAGGGTNNSSPTIMAHHPKKASVQWHIDKANTDSWTAIRKETSVSVLCGLLWEWFAGLADPIVTIAELKELLNRRQQGRRGSAGEHAHAPINVWRSAQSPLLALQAGGEGRGKGRRTSRGGGPISVPMSASGNTSILQLPGLPGAITTTTMAPISEPGRPDSPIGSVQRPVGEARDANTTLLALRSLDSHMLESVTPCGPASTRASVEVDPSFNLIGGLGGQLGGSGAGVSGVLSMLPSRTQHTLCMLLGFLWTVTRPIGMLGVNVGMRPSTPPGYVSLSLPMPLSAAPSIGGQTTPTPSLHPLTPSSTAPPTTVQHMQALRAPIGILLHLVTKNESAQHDSEVVQLMVAIAMDIEDKWLLPLTEEGQQQDGHVEPYEAHDEMSVSRRTEGVADSEIAALRNSLVFPSHIMDMCNTASPTIANATHAVPLPPPPAGAVRDPQQFSFSLGIEANPVPGVVSELSQSQSADQVAQASERRGSGRSGATGSPIPQHALPPTNLLNDPNPTDGEAEAA